MRGTKTLADRKKSAFKKAMVGARLGMMMGGFGMAAAATTPGPEPEPECAPATSERLEKSVVRYWKLVLSRDDRGGTLTFDKYQILHLRITRSLVRVFNYAEAEELAQLDWESDIKTAPGGEVRGGLDFDAFYKAMVELADVWTVRKVNFTGLTQTLGQL
jgi:hypothetical protein